MIQFYTVEEAKSTRARIDGLHCKNLFLRNQKGNRHFLVIFPADKPVDMKSLAPKLGINRISFCFCSAPTKIYGFKSRFGFCVWIIE